MTKGNNAYQSDDDVDLSKETREQYEKDRREDDAPELFDAARFPKLRRVAYSSQYGRMELLEVNETSDGFLIGQARIGEGDETYMHSVFLGKADDFE